jgi:hypothetical protein
MKQLSRVEAFRELTDWSNASPVGFTFARSDATIHFTTRRTQLEVHEPHLLLKSKDSGVTQVFCPDDTRFSVISADEFVSEFSVAGNIKPPFETALCILFPDKDFCLIFTEK